MIFAHGTPAVSAPGETQFDLLQSLWMAGLAFMVITCLCAVPVE